MSSVDTSGPSHEILAKPFYEKADRIILNLNQLKKETRKKISPEEISNVFKKFSHMQDVSIPEISRATGHPFTHPRLFLFIFLYKEIGSLFNKATTNPVQPDSPQLLSPEDLNTMVDVAEDRKTLAYLGDAALETAVLIHTWPDDLSIPRRGFLHDERKKLVANEPLSVFWDSLALCDQDNLMKTGKENKSTRGTSLEAVFGIIYLEGGLPAVERSLGMLQNFSR